MIGITPLTTPRRSAWQRAKHALTDRLLVGVHNIGFPILRRMALSSSAFVSQSVRGLCKEVVYYLAHYDQDRLSAVRLAEMSAAAHEYSDPNLDGQVLFLQRPSGQIAPFLESVLRRPEARHVVEIGCANGSVLRRMADRFPRVNFLGIDLHLSEALKTCGQANLAFQAGYALELFEQAALPHPVDVVYFQFTGVNMLPREIPRYFAAFRRLGVRFLVLNEPTRKWYPIRLEERGPGSVFLGGQMWKHDYPGLARAAGYEVVAFQYKHWSELILPEFNRVRFDTYLMQMIAHLPAGT